jgi:hypothetical protein
MFLRGFLCPDDMGTHAAVEDLDRAGAITVRSPAIPGSGDSRRGWNG